MSSGHEKFKEMIEQEQWDEASEIARKQVKAGAHIIDVCLSNPDRDETHDMIQFLNKVTNDQSTFNDRLSSTRGC